LAGLHRLDRFDLGASLRFDRRDRGRARRDAIGRFGDEPREHRDEMVGGHDRVAPTGDIGCAASPSSSAPRPDHVRARPQMTSSNAGSRSVPRWAEQEGQSGPGRPCPDDDDAGPLVHDDRPRL